MNTSNWDRTTLTSLVQTIAAEYGLKPAVAPSLNAIAYDHVAQIDESDINMLTRLAEPLDAIAAVKAGAG